MSSIPFDADGVKHFELIAPKASADGYGYSAELLSLALDKKGIDVKFTGYDWNEPFCTDPRLFELEKKQGDYEVKVVYFLPYALARPQFRGKKTICMTMFETNKIPKVWVDFINGRSDGCLVPSEFCYNSFYDSGVFKPMAWYPIGMDVDRYTYVERDPSRLPFTFLMSGLLHHRKNPKATYQAFKEAFDENEPVRLVFKTRRNFFDLGGLNISDSRVTVINEDYSREQMQELYASADCLVAPSLGEASGMVPREAMCCGLPVILTDWGGMTEISSPDISYPIPVRGLEKAPLECSSYSAGITQRQDIGYWAKVDVSDIADLMRKAYEERIGSIEKGRAARKTMESRFSIDHTSGLFMDALESVI